MLTAANYPDTPKKGDQIIFETVQGTFVYEATDTIIVKPSQVEILEDKDQKEPIKHHHVHWYVPEAQMPEIQAWYGKHFNAKPGKRGNFLTAYIPGAELAFTKTDKPTVPTLGRTLDHIGFDVKSMDETVKRLEAGGIKLDRPVATAPNGSKLTFIHDPWGASIELNERPGPL